VLAPNECPPPYGTDGVSVDQVLSRPSTVADYKRMVVALCASQERRQKLGTRLQRAIRHHHVGAGWRLHLEQALRQLPSNHQTSRPTLAPCTAGSAYLYWSRFVDRWGQGLHSPLQRSLLQALDLGLKPTLSKAARAKLQASQPRDPASRLAVLACALLCNGVVGHVPKRLAIGVVRGLSFLCGDKRLSRLLSGLTRAVSANPGVRQWYAEYGAPSSPLIRQAVPATRWAAATRALPGDIAASKRGHPHQHEQHS
jgi:hypothetical protein